MYFLIIKGFDNNERAAYKKHKRKGFSDFKKVWQGGKVIGELYNENIL